MQGRGRVTAGRASGAGFSWLLWGLQGGKRAIKAKLATRHSFISSEGKSSP